MCAHKTIKYFNMFSYAILVILKAVIIARETLQTFDIIINITNIQQ